MFTLDDPAAVVLGIFDVRGRLVRRLNLGPRERGLHRVTWDGLEERGHDVRNGVYLVKRLDDGARSSAKLVKTR